MRFKSLDEMDRRDRAMAIALALVIVTCVTAGAIWLGIRWVFYTLIGRTTT